MQDKPDLDQKFVEVGEKLGYPVKVVEFEDFAKEVKLAKEEDSPFAIFKEFYRDEKDLMELYSTVPALREWLMGGGHEGQHYDNFFKSRKVTKFIPDFYCNLESSMECIERDLRFARAKGWLHKYGLE